MSVSQTVGSAAAVAAAPLRGRVAQALRSRVAGKDAAERAARIWGAEGERWFTPSDVIWRVHADAAMFPGGIRSLLLQSLHPLAMAGVAGHSGYRGDPWGRLQRTSSFIATTTFGTVADAERLIARVRGVHRGVKGLADDGRPYAASDPHLLGWVHAAEVDSFLATYRAYTNPALTRPDADAYVSQTAVVAERLGVRRPPLSVAELERTLDGYREELALTPAALDAARFLLLTPPLPWAARPGYGALALGAVATLPRWARELLRLPVLPGVDPALGRAAGRMGTGVIRWAMADPSVAQERRSRPRARVAGRSS